MKEIADWIRKQTPEWTDKQRYDSIVNIHRWLPNLCIVLFVFTENTAVRFFTLCLQLITLGSEFVLRECIVTMVEREFSDSKWDDLGRKLFKVFGWEITRPEKMTFNIGFNLGITFMIFLMLLRQSVLWMIGLAGIAVTVLPTLALFSKVPRFPEIAQLPLRQN